MKRLIGIHFERTNADLNPGQFRSIGPKVEFMPVSETLMYQVELSEDKISKISKVDPVSSRVISEEQDIFIFPAKHFITEDVKLKKALVEIKKELTSQLKKFKKEGKLLEAERIKRRTNYDLAMIREVGYCSGIENYSRHLSGKHEGEPPETLLSYFPRKGGKRSDLKGVQGPTLESPDFLTIIDESHVTLPQLRGMHAGDASRKKTLVEYGFRLPSARDNRPLKYQEFEKRIGSVVYTSATPGEEERQKGEQIVEQIIRPTGLVDPETIIRPVSEKEKYRGQIADFMEETEKTVARGFRVLATTLTKKMAEDLTLYLKDKGFKAEYLHSDIKTMERIRILTRFRHGGKGKPVPSQAEGFGSGFDILVGVNLLREGLDLPEVALIVILDADKEGFLRSETSLIQTIGRAARNSEGKVVLYADILTGSMERAIGETTRRRNIQLAHNKKHGITPKTIIKNIKDITEELESEHAKAVQAELKIDLEVFRRAMRTTQKIKSALSDEDIEKLTYERIIKLKERDMNRAVKELDFESAAILRDEIVALREKLSKEEG